MLDHCCSSQQGSWRKVLILEGKVPIEQLGESKIFNLGGGSVMVAS